MIDRSVEPVSTFSIAATVCSRCVEVSRQPYALRTEGLSGNAVRALDRRIARSLRSSFRAIRTAALINAVRRPRVIGGSGSRRVEGAATGAALGELPLQADVLKLDEDGGWLYAPHTFYNFVVQYEL